jgi:hypothetical protein
MAFGTLLSSVIIVAHSLPLTKTATGEYHCNWLLSAQLPANVTPNLLLWQVEILPFAMVFRKLHSVSQKDDEQAPYLFN